jgi:serine/threonine-protein kinase RsbW
MQLASDRLTLPAQVASVRPFCEFGRRTGEKAGFAEEELDRLELAIEEIVVNIARYAYGPAGGDVELIIGVEGPRRVRVEIADHGRPFNPLTMAPPDFSGGLAERPVGGLGIFLARSIVESMVYERVGSRNILRFLFAPGL